VAKLDINDTTIKSKCNPPGADAKGDAFYWEVKIEGFGVRAKRDGSACDSGRRN
jgi:hypothetical protein